MTAAAVRRELVDALRLDLIGPSPEDAELQEEVLPLAPSRWYLGGYLVSLSAGEKQRRVDAEEEMDQAADEAAGADDGAAPERATTRRIFLPSSMGLSLLVEAEVEALDVTVSWGDYRAEEQTAGGEDDGDGTGGRKSSSRVVWRRTPRQEVLRIALADGLKKAWIPGSDGLELVRLVRPTKVRTETGDRGVRAISLFVVNRRVPREDDRQDQATAFQVRLEVSGAALFVPRTDIRGFASDDWDDRLADLHYRDVAEYAVGHNVSVEAWENQGGCRQVRTTWLPTAPVERIEPEVISGVTFAMETLGALADNGAARDALLPLVRHYRAWIDQQAAVLPGLPSRRREVAEELIRRARVAAGRIEDGIGLLADPAVLTSFRLANSAMAAAARRRRSIETGAKVKDVATPAWRPFQLAFILLNLSGLVEPAHGDREIVDLLFFPTGGGKTEAYLGLAAFTLVWRRLRPASASERGLSVLMRYTLRLLTLDQLGRAAALMCALELMREKDSALLGSHPFEIALWVGRAATPNRMGEKGDNDPTTARVKTLRFKQNSKLEPPLPLEQCPWCGTRFDRDSFHLHPNSDQPANLLVRCVNRDCDFTRDRYLPIVAVDEPIYDRLPGFMIATSDKFAAMPWTGEVARFFGRVGSRELPPPDLIIQDELHLISGPLGTMAGLFETALDHLCTRVTEGKRIRPKIIASTATVRWAEKQIRALFDRVRVEVFPPPGSERRHSFFARQVPASEAEPRLYVGIAAQGRGPKVIFLRTMVTLMAKAQAAWEQAGGDGVSDNPVDPFMTVVAYFNALRELGSARRIVEDEVGARLLTYSNRKRIGEATARFADRRIAYEPWELTSRVGTADVARAKRRLAAPFADKQNRVDVALATNMISVGLDITRLGLMLVSGQPKTTAEYIQATSRVGRDPQKPGLIVTILNIHKPRDRSHYERFACYHASFYRGVEATSVTPFSPRALDRGLAAVSVALARLGIPDLTPPTATSRVRDFPDEIDAIAAVLRDRADHIKPGTGTHVRNRGRSLFDDWVKLADDYAQSGTSFGYQRGPGVSKPLLREVLDPERQTLRDIELRFRAPRSLRDVEPNVLLAVKSPDGKDIKDAD